MKEEEVSLALSLSTVTSGSAAPPSKRSRRRAAATSGEGEFVCKTCSRAFATFQALGGHRTSHMRGRHGLELGVGAKAMKQQKDKPRQQHECHICGRGFEMGQALGGHMRRHREEMHGGPDDWVWRSVARPEDLGHNPEPPVLLELFA